MLEIKAGGFTFLARYEEEAAPATVVEGAENLPALGEKFLWDGAQEIAFREV